MLINRTQIDLQQGDITQQTTDAIVNAANQHLAGGGGVDGAIHRAAGLIPLQLACRRIGHCPPGQAVITPGFKLQARYIIHAVGPIYQSGSEEPPRLLASAHRSSLELAVAHELTSIAFPAISTGIYGYPMAEAATIALQAARDFALRDSRLALIRFVLFDAAALATFSRALEAIAPPEA
ncbi:MAG: O-acetyl-ADP-ribose deacetylase [Anaerolineae bacterium]|nr:O-acetyl-ADP-ribose deacetylase [Anaerolineae bacterium]